MDNQECGYAQGMLNLLADSLVVQRAMLDELRKTNAQDLPLDGFPQPKGAREWWHVVDAEDFLWFRSESQQTAIDEAAMRRDVYPKWAPYTIVHVREVT